ncbi:MAG: hypothetical protein V3S98_00565, partial [Dehalococcoidia bacterium]
IDVTVSYPSGKTELSGYKVNNFPPVLADSPLGLLPPDCPVGKDCFTYFLHNNPTPPVGDTASQTDLPMDTTSSPAFIRYIYDTDEDTDVGRAIRKGGDLSTTDLGKYQNWRTGAFGGDFHICGDVELQLWSASDGFIQARRGEIEVFLRDFDGATFTEIAGQAFSKNDWQEGFDDFTVVKVVLTGLDYTVASGNSLDMRLVVGSGTQTPLMWFMYDFIDFDSKLFVETVSGTC